MRSEVSWAFLGDGELEVGDPGGVGSAGGLLIGWWIRQL